MKISRILLYLAILSVLAPIGDANLGAGLVALTKWITSVLPKYVAQGAVRVAGKVATNVGKASANAGKAVLNTGKNARTLVASKGANLGRGVAQGFRSLGGKGASIIHRGRQVLQKGQHFVQRTYRRVGGNFYKRLKNVPIVDPARSSKWNRLRVIAEVVKQTLKSPKFYYKGLFNVATIASPALITHYMRGPSNDTAEIDTRLQELKEIAADMREVIDAGYGDEMFEPGETHWLDQIEYAEEDDSIPTAIKTAPTYYYADDEEEEDAYDAYDKLLDAYFDDDLYD